VVAEVAKDFPTDARDQVAEGISASPLRVPPVNRVDQPNRADLNKFLVLGRVTGGVTASEMLHHREEGQDQFLTHIAAAGMGWRKGRVVPQPRHLLRVIASRYEGIGCEWPLNGVRCGH
jgi:hypothetical protein